MEGEKVDAKKQTVSREFTVYTLYSDDDDVLLFLTEADALKTKRAWIAAGANDVRGPFGHNFGVEVALKTLKIKLT